MGAKVSVYVGTSLDGFIARKDGNLDWFDAANTAVPAGEDCGYSAFIDSVDVLVMGRKSYGKVMSFGAWPYGDKQVVVLSSRPVDFPAELPSCVTHSAEQPEELHQRLSSSGAAHIYLDGGVTIQRFMNARLVDEITIAVIPVLIGE